MSVTERVYYQDTYLESLEARIIEINSDEDGSYVILDKTIFHPQGGGQPNDKGHFLVNGQEYTLTKLSTSGNSIRHYYTTSKATSLAVNDVAVLNLDMQTRVLYAQIHSAGHLIEDAIRTLYPQIEAYKGFHAPGGQASVNFKLQEGQQLFDLATGKAAIEKRVNELVAQKIPLRVTLDSNNVRSVQFEGHLPLNCGGTHVRHSGEIGKIIIRNIKKEKEGCKVGYDVE